MKIEEIRERRRREISEGGNLDTASPLYIVYEQIFTVCENDTRYGQLTTVFGDGGEYVRHDRNGGERLAESDVEKWGDCEGGVGRGCQEIFP